MKTRTLLTPRSLLPFLLTCALALVSDFASAEEQKVTRQNRRTWDFAEAGVKFTNDFSQARLNECEQIGPAEFKLVISPENVPINPSPWYAFKVSSARTQTLTLRFLLTANGSVLRPRLSRDGKTWTLLGDGAFSTKAKSREAVATIEVGPEPMWIAGQELIGLAELGAWMDQKAALPLARASIVGHSVEKRPLRQLIFSETDRPNYVFIIARQHPPEVTGSIGMLQFVDTLTGDGEIARRYRRHFQTVVIPLMNPDGIEHGHWRSNLGGVDTNRDWKPFTQPETRAVRDAILKLGKAPGAQPFLFIDFHSTGKDVFYAQADSMPTTPAMFTSRWLGAIRDRFPDYRFAREDGHNAGLPTSKAWAYATFGIPAITYELGYNTDRDLIRKVCAGAAEEMMRILLDDSERAGAAK